MSQSDPAGAESGRTPHTQEPAEGGRGPDPADLPGDEADGGRPPHAEDPAEGPAEGA